jgi:hypothetical protein
MRYAISATISHVVNGYSTSHQIPTFFLEGDIQGIMDEKHAEKIAGFVINPFGEYVACISAVKVGYIVSAGDRSILSEATDYLMA